MGFKEIARTIVRYVFRTIVPIVLLIIGIRWAMLTTWKAGYQVYEMSLVFTAIAIAAWLVVDRVLLWRVDTLHELVGRQNVAYGLALVAIALCVLAGAVAVG